MKKIINFIEVPDSLYVESFNHFNDYEVITNYALIAFIVVCTLCFFGLTILIFREAFT